MILLEYDAKAIMAEHGIRVPRGIIARSPAPIRSPIRCLPRPPRSSATKWPFG